MKQLGKRICIIGSVASGKSTLALFLAHAMHTDNVTHLDDLAHLPNTNWIRSHNNILIKTHNHLLQSDSWIIEGNYSICMPERFAKATDIIWLDFNRFHSLYRYIKRCITSDPSRPGKLAGSNKEFSMKMVKHILFTSPSNRIKYKNLINQTRAKTVIISTSKMLNEFMKIIRCE